MESRSPGKKDMEPSALVYLTVTDIRDQEKHHRKERFQEELVGFLKKRRIEYDERCI